MFALIPLLLATITASLALSIPPHSLPHTISLNSSALRLPPPRPSKGLLKNWPELPVDIAISNSLKAIILNYGDYSRRPDDVGMTIYALNSIEDEISHGPPPTLDSPIYLRCENVSFYLEIFGQPWPNINSDIANLISMLIIFTRVNSAAMEISEGQFQFVVSSPRRERLVVAEFMVKLHL